MLVSQCIENWSRLEELLILRGSPRLHIDPPAGAHIKGDRGRREV